MSFRSERTARTAQWLLAGPFLVLGAWCVLAPGSVEALSLRPEHVIDTQASRVLLGCFGAQAMISGIFAAFSRFTRTTFLVYGIGLLPFFWFNYYFTIAKPIFTEFMLIDFVSNAIMLVLCFIGWRSLSPEKGV
jgi:hypothetical protein